MKMLMFFGFIGVLLVINFFGNWVIKWVNGMLMVGKVFVFLVFIVGGLWIIII